MFKRCNKLRLRELVVPREFVSYSYVDIDPKWSHFTNSVTIRVLRHCLAFFYVIVLLCRYIHAVLVVSGGQVE